MRFIATKVKAEDVKPGEMFSTAGPTYWESAFGNDWGAIGERVYLRTLTPISRKDIGTDIYRIEVVED